MSDLHEIKSVIKLVLMLIKNAKHETRNAKYSLQTCTHEVQYYAKEDDIVLSNKFYRAPYIFTTVVIGNLEEENL